VLYQPDPGPMNVDQVLGNYVQREYQKLAGLLKANHYDVSDFMKTVLDDLSASAALTTLGFSTFIQTLLNDVDVDAVQLTLELNKAVRADVVQGFSTAEKLQARQNIDAISQNALNDNLAVNGHFYMNQAFAAVTTSGSYFADQWFIYKNTVGGGAASCVLESLIPENCAKITITTAQAALTANDQYLMAPMQKYEAIRFEGLQWGVSGKERRMLVRFMCQMPAGTYSLWIRDVGTPTRNYLKSFTISAGQANTEVLQEFIIPVPNIGTWANYNGTGALFEMGVTLACSANNIHSADAVWVTGASALFGAPGQSNGFASTSNVFRVYNWGVHVDYDGSGKFPPYRKVDYLEELRRCQRYYRVQSHIISGYNGAGGAIYGQIALAPPMRIAPLVTISGFSYSNASAAGNNGAVISNVQTIATITATGAGWGVGNVILDARFP